MRNIDLYNIGESSEEIREALSDLRADFASHTHDGVNSKQFDAIRAEILQGRVFSIRKAAYTDNTAGFWAGLVGNTTKLFVGDGTNYLKWDGSAVSIAGTITATAGTIGGWIISSSTIASAASGERIVLDQGNKQIELYNASENVVLRMKYGSLTSAAIQKIHIQNDARRGIEFIVGSTLGSDAKCITIDNPSTSICIDMTDGGSTGLSIAGSSQNGIVIQHSGTAAGIDISGGPGDALIKAAASGDYPGIDISYTGTGSNAYGLRITGGANTLKEGILIDSNADSHLAEGMTIDRDGNADNQIVVALRIEAANLGVGTKAVGIDFTGAAIQAIMNVATDATDPTGGGGAATGRIPIYVAGNLKYLAYY